MHVSDRSWTNYNFLPLTIIPWFAHQLELPSHSDSCLDIKTWSLVRILGTKLEMNAVKFGNSIPSLNKRNAIHLAIIDISDNVTRSCVIFKLNQVWSSLECALSWLTNLGLTRFAFYSRLLNFIYARKKMGCAGMVVGWQALSKRTPSSPGRNCILEMKSWAPACWTAG